MNERDIDQRMEEVLGQPPRIDPVDMDNLPPEGHELAVEIRAAFGMPEDGFMPDSFRMMLNDPKLFRAQMAIGIAIATGTIPPRERELAVLRCAWLCRAPYEWGEHVEMGKNRAGISAEEIERCIVGSSAEGWSEHDRAILKGVEELIGDHMISDETWAILARTWSIKQLNEFPVLIGHYVTTAMQQNSLRYRLDKSNTGLRHR
jgi:4-carboxymuconolactone decarboxylase